MLAKRIIPTLLARGRTLIKGEKFVSWRSVGVVEQAVRIHQARSVDELVLLDIDATAQGRLPDVELIKSLTKDCFMPIAVGGGVCDVQDAEILLRAGADKIVMGTHAYTNPHQVYEIARRLGSQALVVAIDVKYGKIWIRCGTQRTISTPIRYAKHLEAQGVGEIIVTNIEREGTMAGYDLELIGGIANSVQIPVIAHGGCSGYEDMAAAIKAGASAVAAGALYQFSDLTPQGAAEFMAAQGIEVRQ